jgi:hypothetical protein
VSNPNELRGPRPPLALTLIALIGAALSFNGVRLAATPHAGLYGGIGTAMLFDLAMWLSARWYIATVRAGKALRPALWLSMVLVAVTLIVNVNGAHGLADQVTHGIGPALFAAFTWLEAVMQLRAYRKEAGERDRVPLGYAAVHPVRSARITLMMLGAGEKSFTRAKAMCQNREATRRRWRTDHGRRWQGKVDPVIYTAYRWGAFDANALTLTGPIGVPENTADAVSEPAAVRVPDAVENTARPALTAVPETLALPAAAQPQASSGNGEISAVRRSALLAAAREVERWRGNPSATRISKELGIGMPLAVSIANVLREEDQATAKKAADAQDSTGRILTAAQVADLIRQADGELPGVREVMHTYRVAYDKAKTALDLITNDGNAAA